VGDHVAVGEGAVEPAFLACHLHDPVAGLVAVEEVQRLDHAAHVLGSQPSAKSAFPLSHMAARVVITLIARKRCRSPTPQSLKSCAG
jgi:hypothetical protein